MAACLCNNIKLKYLQSPAPIPKFRLLGLLIPFYYIAKTYKYTNCKIFADSFRRKIKARTFVKFQYWPLRGGKYSPATSKRNTNVSRRPLCKNIEGCTRIINIDQNVERAKPRHGPSDPLRTPSRGLLLSTLEELISNLPPLSQISRLRTGVDITSRPTRTAPSTTPSELPRPRVR